MDLHSDYPYWMIREGIDQSYPVLRDDLRADVVVIGGGITGALVAHALCEAGLDVVVLEKRHIAHGSTSASTALLQYEIDMPLFKLGDKVGKTAALRAYQLCYQAIDELESLCNRFTDKADFERHPSLWYASWQRHVGELLKPEFSLRRAHGFDVQWLTQADIERKFGFKAPAGLLSAQAAQVNPYRLANQLFRAARARGARIHELTKVTDIETTARGVTLQTNTGCKLRARYVVVAAGYESPMFLPHAPARMHSSYAIVSKPLARQHQWYRNALLWETRQPYTYLRTTGDKRIIIGGRDEMFYSPGKRDRLLSTKSRLLLRDFQRMFPHIPFETDFAWTGTFNETRDSLPYIGPCGHKRVLFAMGYGGNGITFSVIAARLLRDHVAGLKTADGKLFAFDR